MKKLEEIIKQEPVFLNDWSSRYEVIYDFEDLRLSEEQYLDNDYIWRDMDHLVKEREKVKEAFKKFENIHILFASYGQGCYEGDAWVLFETDEKLYEVNGSHCSCYGLEGQWEPEEVTLEELEHRLVKGTFGQDSWSFNEFRKELLEFLGIEEEKKEIEGGVSYE